MSKSRMTLIAAVAAFAVMLVGGVGTAAAQEPTKASQIVDITGKAKNGKQFTGTYTIKRFTHRGDQIYAVGTMQGKLKNRKVKRSNVRIPVSLKRHSAATTSQLPPVTDDPDPTAGACQVLDLVLNPIDLNLLGLRVATSRIEVLVEAIPGANALLGNLLCGITGILDPQGTTAQPVGILTRVLNALLALLPRTA